MKEQIKEFIYKRGQVSFAELSRVIPGFEGERVMCHDNDSLVLWGNVSPEFAKAIRELIKDNEIVMQGCSPMVYFADGAGLKLPIASQLKEYRHSHWLPVTLSRP